MLKKGMAKAKLIQKPTPITGMKRLVLVLLELKVMK